MKIFLDDERFPAAGDDMTIVRSYYGFCLLIKHLNLASEPQKIEFISFDHDLGPNMSGLDCAKFLVSYDMDHNILTKGFTFYVHSQNPVGKANIEGYLNNYLDTKFGAF